MIAAVQFYDKFLCKELHNPPHLFLSETCSLLPPRLNMEVPVCATPLMFLLFVSATGISKTLMDEVKNKRELSDESMTRASVLQWNPSKPNFLKDGNPQWRKEILRLTILPCKMTPQRQNPSFPEMDRFSDHHDPSKTEKFTKMKLLPAALSASQAYLATLHRCSLLLAGRLARSTLWLQNPKLPADYQRWLFFKCNSYELFLFSNLDGNPSKTEFFRATTAFRH